MSIAYLPEIYPDELIYSWVSRFYCHNGYLNSQDALKDILRSNGRLTFEFSGQFNTEIGALLNKFLGDCRTFYLDHTLFTYYTRFYDNQSRLGWLNGIATGRRAAVFQNLLELDKSYRYLQYCPLCTIDDRYHRGETYYHREHQIPGVVCCVRHKCLLKQTNIRIHQKKEVDLVPAEQIIPVDEIAVPTNGLALEYSRYLVNVLNSPFNADYVPVGKFLRDRIDAKFFHPLERSLDLMAISEEMLNLLRPIGLTSLPYYYLGYVLKGYSHDPRVIIMLAYYLNIPVEELCNPPPTGSSAELYLETERDEYL